MEDRLIALLYFGSVNAILFVLMGIDKYRAKKKMWRIPEKTLLSFGILGGILGMVLFHHKIRLTKFKVIYLLGLVLMLGMLYFLFDRPIFR
ncbi:hypothetical protein CKN82_09530 [Carnobacterium divergens]|nr:DUF1294 domain-containing protein [Carnobacterium divergens]MDT1995093.1 DUF1294 domain-containing protein [Carnobacterium divergens]TFI64261.1 hypothetical protein CKN59_09305 [Carnobacterium divergens]TFI64505.1 hypothetical protein CKN76_09315 [Carnobacterium divergens]TFI67519.1 hypothetical protein CKN70_09580 [Carnobacterium divergens]TFI79669.1 hypothetical protein CKN74_09280 [Carnobacterium divergens]